MSVAKESEDFHLEKLFTLLWNSKYLIIFIASLFAVTSIYYSLQMPNKYKSSALIVVVDPSKNNSSSSMLSRFGGLASVAGISLPSSSGGDKSILAVETIKSRDFFNILILDHDILPELYAAQNYDKNRNEILYSNVFNGDKRLWNTKKNLSLKPSNQQAYKVYRSILDVGISDKSGYMSISVTHVSPEFANQLITLVVNKTNTITRKNDLTESETALKYLTNLMSTVAYEDIKYSLSTLIESQLETQMLVNIREDDYLLKYIDKPFSPETKFSPRRSLYVIMATILGALLGILFVIYKDKKKVSFKH
jgi:capsular polysaccharide biosynthesis protein